MKKNEVVELSLSAQHALLFDSAKHFGPWIAEWSQNSQEFARAMHDISLQSGWTDPVPVDRLCALLTEEVGEVVQADRVGLDQTKLYISTDGKNKPEGIAAELADVVIRCFETASRNDIPLVEALMIKARYNATRPKKHGGKRY